MLNKQDLGDQQDYCHQWGKFYIIIGKYCHHLTKSNYSDTLYIGFSPVGEKANLNLPATWGAWVAQVG